MFLCLVRFSPRSERVGCCFDICSPRYSSLSSVLSVSLENTHYSRIVTKFATSPVPREVHAFFVGRVVLCVSFDGRSGCALVLLCDSGTTLPRAGTTFNFAFRPCHETRTQNTDWPVNFLPVGDKKKREQRTFVAFCSPAVVCMYLHQSINQSVFRFLWSRQTTTAWLWSEFGTRKWQTPTALL